MCHECDERPCKQHPTTRCFTDRPKRWYWCFWAFPFLGLASLVWFLIRVIPKPTRATYPCQRLAAPLAGGFVVWLLGVGGSVLACRKVTRLFRESRRLIACAFLVLAVVMAWWSVSLVEDRSVQGAFVPSEPPNRPMGVGQGIHPGRVVWVHEPDATRWDGVTGAWWEDEHTDQDLVDAMVSQAVRMLTGRNNDTAAWDALFRHFNQTRDLGDVGYQDGEEIAIKINMNLDDGSKWDWSPAVSLPSPQVIFALLDQLINKAGVPGGAILLYDASRYIGDPIYDKVRGSVDPNFQAVRFFVRPEVAKNGRLAAERDTAHPVHFSHPNVPHGARAYLPRCVTEAKYLINMTLLRPHQMSGITLCAKNHFGSICFDIAFRGGWTPEPLHDFAKRNQAPGSYNCLVDLIGHPHLGGKTLLYIIDGLYGAEHQNANIMRYASFGEDWTSSLLVSQDPIAIDSVGLDILRNEPKATWCAGQGVENYLHEAALADSPPSGIHYDPKGDGTGLMSLGVHEHWNNAQDKQYSVNLGLGDGIELIVVGATDSGYEALADLTADGVVDAHDLAVLFQTWLAGLDDPWWDPLCDLSTNGRIDLGDFTVLAGAWGWREP
ncbi:DUF362 domain-containing protein [Anaerobaca lacustris]|uniref:DUF362 domain-containing protein n=1 Tax=Anaerobaca lacustris TaxID=3044600 RepID=A0AAW6U1P6_9BACT|nr:DUF362 domain-containing protein [Sedimentisphaerales bacterium M17dextr]